MYEAEVLDVLREIRDLLEPVSKLSREQYLHDKKQLLNEILTPGNRQILPLLFDPRRLTQDKIAEEAGVSQPTVSRFISELKAKRLIAEEKDNNLNKAYIDVWGLLDLIKENQ